MFWFFFVLFIAIGCIAASIIGIFQDMRYSKYQIVRTFYWIGAFAFYIMLFVWIWSW
jgi:hypothetical protein